ncbi:hypothetical protein CON15_19700 [Bacillus cereus]|uniref:hypothetical protein n=1 Tax=Bacillus cereus TaxID=1396 RepID=UPI000BEBC7A2|nr:hypothetical protein [Bacillus cereus]PDZ55767.1 hypothetical protein CON15_19700 [Bacillus cereus]
MAERLIKCQICGAKAPKSELKCLPVISPKTGRTTNKYFHEGDCWQEHLEKAKGKLVGCKICGKQARQADMKVVKKSTNSYYHEGECWDKYLENKAFKEKEKEEMDYLWDVFEKVNGFPVPSRFVTSLQDLRNGSILYGKVKRRFKQGYSYTLIAETYLECAESIEWAKKTKNFKNTLSECRYGLAIISNNIVNVRDKIARKARQREEIKESVAKMTDSDTTHLTTNVNYNKNKQKKRVDISDLL